MNVHEERAWKRLVELGARETRLFGKHAIDLTPIRLTTKNKLAMFTQAVIDVVGRSNANRRHVDRRGLSVYVVTDFYTLDRTDRERHAPELQALSKKNKSDTNPDTPTTWAIHTMGGPVHRVFSTVEIAKRWAFDEWSFPKTIDGLVAANRLSQPTSKREANDVQQRLDHQNAEHFERTKSGEIVIAPGSEEDWDFTFGIRYKGKNERVFATIGERQHCTCCGRVIATRSNVNGKWHPSDNDHDRWPKDLMP